jgi:phosphoribosylaminoimidazole (AIR) synthetase
LYDFLLREGKVPLREAYATFNRGAGFAVYVKQGQAERCVAIASEVGFSAWVAGAAEKQRNRKAVEIVPHSINFDGDTLQVRT